MGRISIGLSSGVLLGLVSVLMMSVAQAEEQCQSLAGRFVSIQGSVEVQRSEGAAWQAASLTDQLCEGDSIRVGEQSRAAIAMVNEAVLRIDQNTAMRLLDINAEEEERSFLDLLKGAIQSFSRKPKKLTVNTPYLNGSIEGTEFVFRVEEESSILTVFEGTVVAANNQGSLDVSGGESVVAAKGRAPQARTMVRPRDAAQWSLYYPPILATGGESVSPALQQAADSLYVGQVDAARSSVEQAIAAGGADAGLAHALRAVIHVVQNEREQALADAQQGVSLSPDSAAAKIALSYAQQANFQINAARDTLQAAVAQQPNDALAHARLAELQLMLGDRRAANASAETAVGLAPNLARTQITLGFAALAEFRNAEAKAAFEQAIAQDSADPLPRLGLGLAKISNGELAAGRQEIEAAVALDSNNALLRSYLGKAYFEEKRGPLDGEQFEIAKQLDPNDPTPYLYSGIAKQTENRPVEALADLEKSIELNDNRAAFRGRLLLDKDRAARGTSLGRVYNDLGFRQLGINSAVNSVTLDPANASAHRFLSDTYMSAPRHETARVSELQQAQMLQDININPIQPSVSDTNLNIVTQGGPANAGFNEFTPLFERNRAQLNVTGFAGSNDTNGGEAVVSGVYDKLSLSAGAFGYNTDGYRPNNDLDNEIYNLFAQVAISPTVNLQAEYQDRDSDFGDLDMNFDPSSFAANQRNSLDSESWRVGLTVRPSQETTFMLLYNRADQDFKQTDETVAATLPFPPFLDVLEFSELTADEQSDQFEGAFIYQADSLNVLAGAAYTDVDREDTTRISTAIPPLVPVPVVTVDESEDLDSKDKRAYVYGNFELPNNVLLTLGGSYQEFDGESFDLDKFNPKIGVVWSPTDSLRVRSAYFKVIKPVLSANRTLEPTQVAGFNQFFDDLNATRSERYGVGIDWQTTPELAIGAELTERELDSPSTNTLGNPVFDDQDESTHRAYAYWTPSDRWAVSAEGVYDKFENSATGSLIIPDEVRTVSLPVKATYFHPQGLFGSAGVTYVDQKVRRDPASTLPEGNDSFSIVDLALGYRLPQRRGIVSLTVHNLFDEEFMYQDNSYREFGDEPSVSPYTPERLFMARLMLNF